jgi:Zn-dependent M32 family carboxypeptidase
MADWDKLNEEFDKRLDSMTSEEWNNWKSNRDKRKYRQVAQQFTELFNDVESFGQPLLYRATQQCAQILIDQLIQNYEFDCIAQTIGKFDPMDKLNFYDNVKIELNKL